MTKTDKYIDRAALFNSLANVKTIGEVFAAIQDAPAEDVEKVVRCRECKYQNKGQNECDSWNMCEYRSWLYFPVNDEDFCSNGERKNG